MQPHKRAKKGKVKTSVLPHSGKRRTIIKKEEQEPIGNRVKVSQRVRYIMVKEGPCRHCGIETTPLWRNGPSSKPVLCNACGSRWRTRGTLHDYVPKHSMIQYMSGLPASASASASSDSSKSSSHDAAGPSEPNFRNVPKRRRSNTDQIVLTAVERLNKQLYDIMHENPEVFLKEKRVEDVLINRADGRMSTQPETALGAMLLDSEPRDRESVSSSSVKTSDASNSQGNGGNGDNSPENGGNGGDQGESSFT